MKVWVTKYALTKGIFEVEIRKEPSTDGYVSFQRDGHSCVDYFHGQEWWPDRERAVIRARVMRDAKLKRLRKEIIKLEAMEFK